MIYALVATYVRSTNKEEIEAAGTKHVCRRRSKSDRMQYNRMLKIETDKQKIVQPGLFRINRQIRCEGLPLFFQLRHFRFDLYKSLVAGTAASGLLCFENWMNVIGPVGLNSLRSLTLTFYNIALFSGHQVMNKMNILHARLSDQAKVTYNYGDAFGLWELGLLFGDKNERRYPKLLTRDWDNWSRTWRYTYDHGLGITTRVPPSTLSHISTALVFEPNIGWFGPQVSNITFAK